MKLRNSIHLLLLSLLVVCSGLLLLLLLLPCQASESSINDTQPHHRRHPPVKALHHLETADGMVEGGERATETVRKGGKGTGGKGTYGGADVLRQPNQRRSGAVTVMFGKSKSSLFPSAAVGIIITMLLFLASL